MIILDTNVVSEPMRRHGEPRVAAWLDRQVADTLFLTTVSLAELLYGVACLPVGRRRKTFEVGLEETLASLFGPRLLTFDAPAARIYPRLLSTARASGRSIGVADGYIAAVAASRGFMVATRDTSPFEAAGIATLNPWTI